MIKIFAELRRRNVFRVCGAYVVAAWFLVQTAFTLESVMNLPDWFDAFVISLAMMGLPVVAILAWAFELTPEGFKRTEIVSKEDSIAETTGKRLDIAIFVGLLLVAGILVFDRVKPDRAAPTLVVTTNSKSLAVLPFENRSEAVSDAFFADGIHDELLTALSRVTGLDVISRTSVMGYRDTDKRVPDIATELGVGTVLEGAVQRSGERVRISVQLIDGGNDRQIWAESYDRPLSAENIFDIQAEITRVIAGSLEGVLLEGERAARPTENVDAYELYIQAQLLNQPGEQKEDDLRAAIRLYEKALALDPTYAESWAGKAKARLALYRLHGRQPVEREAAQAALDRAKAFGANLPDTLIWDAFYKYWGEGDLRAADAAFDKALTVAPGNVDALAGKAFITRSLGEFQTAANGLEKARRLDPLSYYLVPELALTYALMGQDSQAENLMDKARAMDPDSLQGAAFGAAIAQFGGRSEQAWLRFQPLAEFLPYDMVNYALATRDPNTVRAALESWPVPTAATTRDRILAELNVSGILERPSEDITQLKSSLRAYYDPEVNWENPAYSRFILVAAWLDEREQVLTLAESYGDRASEDAIAGISAYADIAIALIRIGETERAFDFIEKLVGLTGPHILRVLEQDPAYDSLQDHPRWLAIDAKS